MGPVHLHAYFNCAANNLSWSGLRSHPQSIHYSTMHRVRAAGDNSRAGLPSLRAALAAKALAHSDSTYCTKGFWQGGAEGCNADGRRPYHPRVLSVSLRMHSRPRTVAHRLIMRERTSVCEQTGISMRASRVHRHAVSRTLAVWICYCNEMHSASSHRQPETTAGRAGKEAWASPAPPPSPARPRSIYAFASIHSWFHSPKRPAKP
jgi:hypothetical protein